jgi:hypothetical protein
MEVVSASPVGERTTGLYASWGARFGALATEGVLLSIAQRLSRGGSR